MFRLLAVALSPLLHTLCSTVLLLNLPAAAQAADEILSLTPTQDNSIVMVDGEWSENAGSSGRIRIKGNQHIVAMGFDFAALRGRQVRRARLICTQASETIAGVTISAIAVPWNEQASNALTAGTDSVTGWGAEGVRFPAVCGGNAYTLVHQSDAPARDGVYSWDIHPDLIHANILGLAFGLAIHEHSADYSRNPTIYAREQSGRGPRLELELESESTREPVPGSPRELKVTLNSDGMPELSFVAPEVGFGLELTVDGQPVRREHIPLLRPGQHQTIVLPELLAESRRSGSATIGVRSMNRNGAFSDWTKLDAERVQQRPLPQLPSRSVSTAAGPKAPAGVAVVPVCDRYDQSGNAVGDLPPDYRTANPIFDGRRITLSGAAGEVVSLQLLLRGEGRQTVSVEFAGQQPDVRLFRAVYVKAGDRRIPDPLLPVLDPVPLQQNQDAVIVADISIPFDAAAGTWKGNVRISDGRVIPVLLEVYPFQLPRAASFFCEMNSYGLPDHVEDYYEMQRAAHDNRVHLNILHYSHNTAAAGARKSNLDMRLRSGRRMDNRRYDAIEPGARHAYWDDFAAAFGPVLDGSLFADQHRGAIPVPGFYLTFHESWPLNCRRFFNGDPDAMKSFAEHPEYAATWTAILRDFGTLAKSKGWNSTGFQVYLNNKGSLNEPEKSPWVLDEPAGFWDYRALRYYGELADAGRTDAENVRIDYRIDISRPEYTRGELSGRSDHWVVSAGAFAAYRSLVQEQQRQNGLKIWIYGTTPDVDQSSRSLHAWAVDSWLGGASGLVPWQTVNKSGSALQEADTLGIFIMDSSAGERPAVRQTLRLKAWRDTQQLIEYLILLKAQRQLTSAQLQQFIEEHVSIRTRVSQRNADDAGALQAEQVSPASWHSLRQATAALLMAP
jgi:hypothetical protein